MSKYTNVMVDLETMSTDSKGAIVSLGAVMFDPEAGEVYPAATFEENVDLQSCIDAGLIVDGSTVSWWLTQSDAARKHLFVPKSRPLDRVLGAFGRWLLSLNPEPRNIKIWGNGASFDPVMLDNAYKAVGIPTPWKHWNVRDTRTVVDLYGKERYEELKKALIRQLSLDPRFELHTALSDAILQAEYTAIMWKNMQMAFKG